MSQNEPECIQPHRVLLALQEPDLSLLQVSNNTFDFFGIHPHDLLGKNLDNILDEAQLDSLKKSLSSEYIQDVNHIKLTIKSKKNLSIVFFIV